MAKPNYGFAKHQRDLAKKQKQEEKRRQKLANKSAAVAASGAPTLVPESAEPGPPDH